MSTAPSASPQSASGYALDSESIFLQWSPPPFEHQNGLIRMYIINVTEVDTGVQFQYTSVTTQYILRSLHPYYTYEFVIEAVTVAPGPPTSVFSIQTNQDGKCYIPCIVCGNMFLAEVVGTLQFLLNS